jgi:hypothetical protein
MGTFMSDAADDNRTHEWVITIRCYTSEQMAQAMFDDIDKLLMVRHSHTGAIAGLRNANTEEAG